MNSNHARFTAFDVFRGLAIAFMILVNTPGDWGHVYAPLLHSEWHGLTPTDMVFPSFLFIVGASVFFAFRKKGFELNASSVVKIVKRALIMFAIGYGLNVYNYLLLDLESIRTMGVLQRIAICYCLGSLVVLSCSIARMYLVCVVILTLYYLIFVIWGGNIPFELHASVVARFDTAILGENHMWAIQGVAFDPEGLLSTLPATVTLLFGFETARRLHSLTKKKAIVDLFKAAVVLVLIAYISSFAMPVNKNIWSISFVFISAAVAQLVLVACIWLSDIRPIKLICRPFEIFGTNPLFVYCLSWIIATGFMAINVSFAGHEASLYTSLWLGLSQLFSLKLASLIFALLHVAFFWMVSYILYRKNIIVKI